MTSYGKTYTYSFPLNGLKCWVPVGSLLKVLEKAGKAVGGVEESC